MYYHSRQLKYVEYGKVFPPPPDVVDEWMGRCYNWLKYYCGYSPQVWLSRSNFAITGFKRRYQKEHDAVLFGFDFIQGFPVSYEPWEFLMNFLMNATSNKICDVNAEIHKGFVEMEKDCIAEKWAIEGDLKDWIDCGRDLDTYLQKHLFIEKDQVVVPSLNLKSAKQIICRNEKQKKALRKMGFIEDRIVIKNIKLRKW